MHIDSFFLKALCFSFITTIITLAQSGWAKDQPNFLIIITDDQNDWSVFDKKKPIKTPSLDKLSKESITFTQAYAASPVCGASRAAFFSGLHPHTSGGYYNAANFWGQGSPSGNAQTLAEYFKKSGYTTYGQGKLYHAEMTPARKASNWSNKPKQGGFGPFPAPQYGIGGQTKNKRNFWGVQEWTGPDTDFPDVVNANAMAKFLQSDQSKPFMAIYGLWRPHSPFTSPKRFFDMYNPDKITWPKGYRADDMADIPDYGKKLTRAYPKRWADTGSDKPKDWKRLLHGYYAGMSFADWNIGRVIDALDSGPNAKDTIVVFWSDNGFHLGEKLHFGKGTVWEQGSHIPAMIRLPGEKNRGKKVKTPITNVDFYPTLVELSGLEGPAHTLDGRSLTPLLANPQIRWQEPALMSYGKGVLGVRDLRYRYIRYPDGTEEFYDHKRDPKELDNRIHDKSYRKEIERLSKYYPQTWAPSLGGRKPKSVP